MLARDRHRGARYRKRIAVRDTTYPPLGIARAIRSLARAVLCLAWRADLPDTASVDTSNESDEVQLARLQAKLAPERIRATLAFAGLYQMTHEMIKHAVVDEVVGFYGKSLMDETWWYGEDEYKAAVLTLAPMNVFKASLLWLVNSEAITSGQAERLDAIYAHRHELTHELVKYIVDLGHEPDVDLFIDALAILSDIRRFWTGIEMDVGTFDEYGDIGLDEVTPASIAILGLCIDAYAAALEEPPG